MLKRWAAFALPLLIVELLALWYFLRPSFGTGGRSYQPALQLHYSGFFDKVFCPPALREKIHPDWEQELSTRLPEWQKRWTKEGDPLAMTAAEITGHSFDHSTYRFEVVLCPGLPDWGLPPLLSASFFLQAALPAGSGAEAAPMNRLPDDILFENVLHDWLALFAFKRLWAKSWNPSQSPLLRKYGAEQWYTRMQLHAFALQKAVYLQLDKKKKWQELVVRMKFYPSIISRAVEIVEAEGERAFIDELR